MNFQDLNDYRGSSCYIVCNEHVPTWRKALKDVSVDRAAAICSGGEISFFGILPSVKKELQLIDHSYQSMYSAIGKYFIIETLGTRKAHKMLATGDTAAIDLLFSEANRGLTTGVVGRAPRAHRYTLGRAYQEISQTEVAAFRKNREKITFLHGDLNDLADRGPFDLVYLSNALDYLGRNGGAANVQLEKIVKPGGLVALTHQSFSKPAPTRLKEFEILFSQGHGGVMRWNYVVCKAPE